MKQILITMILASSVAAFAQTSVPPQAVPQGKPALTQDQKQELKADRDDVMNKCSNEIQQSGCSGKGHALGMCIHAYKKEHKDFKVSNDCKDSMMKMHHDKKEIKKESKS